MGIHAASSTVAPFNGRCIRGGVAQMLQDTLHARHRAMNVANIDFDHTLAFTPLHDLYMGQGTRNTVTHFGKAPAVALTAGAVGLAENLWEQASVAGFTIREQDQLMPISKALGCLFQQTSNERFIAPSLHVRHDKLAHRVNDLRLPLWLAFSLCIAVSFVRL